MGLSETAFTEHSVLQVARGYLKALLSSIIRLIWMDLSGLTGASSIMFCPRLHRPKKGQQKDCQERKEQESGALGSQGHVSHVLKTRVDEA